jgi:hypothetical protein
MPKFKNLSDFRSQLIMDKSLQEEFKNNPAQAAQNIDLNSPLATDQWIYRIVVASLGATVIAIILGIIVLMAIGTIKDDKSVPTIFTALGSAAIGALAGLLAPSPGQAYTNE